MTLLFEVFCLGVACGLMLAALVARLESKDETSDSVETLRDHGEA